MIVLSFSSCEKDEDPVDTNFSDDKQIVFWSDFQGPPIDVNINGTYRGTITAIGNSAPDCGSSGNVTIDVGNANSIMLYAEEQQTGRTWETSITISDASCTTFRLYE